jgi:transposase-like protein
MPLSGVHGYDLPHGLRNLDEFESAFPDDEACLEFLWLERFSEDGEHAECPRCGGLRKFKRYDMRPRRRSWTCTGCGFHLHPTVGTIFERSSTSLRTWFLAMFLVASGNDQLTARSLQRRSGVTYKTAWRILHSIRETSSLQRPGPLAQLFQVGHV